MSVDQLEVLGAGPGADLGLGNGRMKSPRLPLPQSVHLCREKPGRGPSSWLAGVWWNLSLEQDEFPHMRRRDSWGGGHECVEDRISGFVSVENWESR